ncbi:glycoside hydrolase family 30 protein [Microbispora triticiradicis]|uniref:glycoside hydrolase family 30 protein n=1 Tax=Microbispora triticiradicis TaxID=2200763 RepID=UPI003A5994FE
MEDGGDELSLEARVDFGTKHQEIHGFGFCQAFQRAAVIRDLPASSRQEVLDLLLSPATGAGLSILRLGIGSSADGVYPNHRSIQPADPGGPAAPPRYVWDGDDSGQVWLAKQAQAYGVSRFYASAWSAPGYMKDNGSDADGGTLRGLPGVLPAGDDWREGYAEYLLQYVRFYASEGIRITDLGFANEPEIARPYATMQLNTEQMVDLAKVVGRAVNGQGLPLNVVCCDSLGWNFQAEFTAAIEADPLAAASVAIHGAHQYGSRANEHERMARSPLPTRRPNWMTEWSPDVLGDGWNARWDSGDPTDGIAVARNIHDCLTMADVSAYIYWFGASPDADTRALIRIDGERFHVSKRLGAVAAFSRFIRPGAKRVSAHVSDGAVKVSAFENPDSSRVVELLNDGHEPFDVDVSAGPYASWAGAAAYLTDSAHSLDRTHTARPAESGISVRVPPRALLTIVVPGGPGVAGVR